MYGAIYYAGLVPGLIYEVVAVDNYQPLTILPTINNTIALVSASDRMSPQNTDTVQPLIQVDKITILR